MTYRNVWAEYQKTAEKKETMVKKSEEQKPATKVIDLRKASF